MDLPATVHVVVNAWEEDRILAAFVDRDLAEVHAGQIHGGGVVDLPLLQAAPTRIVEHVYTANYDDGIAGHVGVIKPAHYTMDWWSYDPPDYLGWADGQPHVQQREPRPRPWRGGVIDWGYVQVRGIDQARAEQAFHERIAQIRARPGEG